MLLQVFPLLALSAIVYNIIVLVTGDVEAPMFFQRGIEITLFSGEAGSSRSAIFWSSCRWCSSSSRS